MIEIDYKDTEISRVFKNFKGVYDGRKFIISANWEIGDDTWEIDFISFHGDEPENLVEVERQISQEFYDKMN